MGVEERVLSMEQLRRESLTACDIRVVPQHWEDGEDYTGFWAKPRPHSSFFFIFADMAVTYTMADGRKYLGLKNDLFYLPRGVRYTVDFARREMGNGPDTYVLDFDLFDARGKRVMLGHDVAQYHIQSRPLNDSILQKIYAVCHDEYKNQLYLLSLFFELLNAICSSVSQEHSNFYVIRRGVELLRQEWEKNERIARYAQACGVSESHFRALFHQWAGMGPVQYRNRLRISHAQSYLVNSPMRVDKIAAMVGFDDVFYFSRLFKKITGVSPRAYRGQ